MSSPKRAAPARKAAAPVAQIAAKPAAKAVKATAGKTTGSKTTASQMAAGKTSSKDKAAFLKALAQGIAPDTEAARTVAKKSGSAPASALAKAPQTQVEILRRIPAPAPVVDTPASAEALAFAASIEKALADGRIDVLQPHAQQALMAALVKLYAANAEAGERYAVLGQRAAVTATDVMITCGALLKAVDLQVFELGMWQSWSNG